MDQGTTLVTADSAPDASSSQGTIAYVARQPIFDRHREVIGYELLHRDGVTDSFPGQDSDQATRITVNTMMHLTGFRTLVSDKLAFVNMTRALLLEGMYTLLPRGQTVVELLETIAPDAEVLAACRKLKDAGYTLALDDFVFAPEYEPLMAMADVIKIDFLNGDGNAHRTIIERYARPGLKFLAEKIETDEHYQQAMQLGYAWFQGYFFCKPQIQQSRELGGARQHYVRFLQQITQPQLDYDKLDQTLKAEPSLSVKLLRYLNSPAVGLPERVSSIHHALTMLGERWLRQWGTLVAMTCLGEGKPSELLRLCLVRARFCELVGADLGGDVNRSSLFLMGLFSAMDAVLDRPMTEVLSDLPLPRPVKSALLGDSSRLAKLLLLAQASERGDWKRAAILAKLLALREGHVGAAHTQALIWADEVLSAVTSRN